MYLSDELSSEYQYHNYSKSGQYRAGLRQQSAWRATIECACIAVADGNVGNIVR